MLKLTKSISISNCINEEGQHYQNQYNDDNDEHLTEKESLIKKILELQRTVEDVENKVKKVRCQFSFLNSVHQERIF